MARRSELDVLRGLMLVLITITHLPTVFSGKFSQPFGFVSAAEGFVFLSAFLAGAFYTEIARNKGLSAMRKALWRRASKIYLAHAGMLVFLFTIIAAIGISTQSLAIKNLISFYLEDPVTALWTGFTLIYNPPLLDILPMYVFFMLASPLVLSLGLRLGWTPILAGSIAVWTCAQFGLARLLYSAIVAATNLKVPLTQTGAFELVAWQFMWILGLWLGSSRTSGGERPLAFPRWVVFCAVAVALYGFAWRHFVGQQPFGEHNAYNVLTDKWQLGPLRMVNFLALLVVTVRFGPLLARVARFRFLEVLGRASLPVFCTQLVITLLALCALGTRHGTTPLWAQVLLLAGTFAAMHAVAALAGSTKGRLRARMAGPPVATAGAA